MRYLGFVLLMVGLAAHSAETGKAALVDGGSHINFGGDYTVASSDYGNDGYWYANVNAPSGTNTASATANAVSSLPSYVTNLSFSAGVDSAGGWGGYQNITLPSGGAPALSGALEFNNTDSNAEEIVFSFDVTEAIPGLVRFGLLVDHSDALKFTPVELRVTDGADNILFSPRAAGNSADGDIYFVDISGLSAGDTVSVYGTNDNGDVGHIGGFTFDTLATTALGDANGDGEVDELDFAIIRDNLGDPVFPVGSLGDVNFNGVVELADFRLWKNQASHSALVAAGLVVPEPTSACLAGVAVLACFGTRSRRRS